MRRVFFLNIFVTLDKYVKLFEIKKMRKLENKELERKSVTAFKEATKTPIIIILDDIRSLHNIGSVFRTADAFLIEKIYLCGITAIPPNKEIHKTALGATETVAWEYQKDILNVINKLKSENVNYERPKPEIETMN